MNTKAMENAKANAVSFTKPLGQNIGKALYIGNVNNIVSQLSGSGAGIMIRGASTIKKYDMQAQDYNTNIEFEKISISSQIGVRFALD